MPGADELAAPLALDPEAAHPVRALARAMIAGQARREHRLREAGGEGRERGGGDRQGRRREGYAGTGQREVSSVSIKKRISAGGQGV